MLSFGKNDKEKKIKPLSEDEIQKKLYGRVRKDLKPQKAVQESPVQKKTAPEVSKPSNEEQESVSAQSVRSGTAIEEQKEEKASTETVHVDFKKASDSTKKDEPELDDSAASTEREKDLFSMNEVEFPAFDESEFLSENSSEKKEKSPSGDLKPEKGEDSIDEKNEQVRVSEQIEKNARKAEIDENIWASNQEEETRTFELEKGSAENAKPSGNIYNAAKKPSLNKTGSSLDKKNDYETYTSSFRIDFAEFIDKMKAFLPMFILVTVIVSVAGLVGFNIWIREKNRSQEADIVPAVAAVRSDSDSIAVVAAEPKSNITQSVSRRAEVTVTPVKTAVVNNSASSSQISSNPTGESSISEPVTEVKELSSYYSIQICVYEDVERTEKLVAEFEKAGFESFYRKVTTRSGRTLFTVFIGKYAESSQANRAFAQFKKTKHYQQFSDSFIKWLKKK